MLDYVKGFMRELSFDSEAVDFLSSELEKIYSNTKAKELFESALFAYDNDINTDFSALVANATKSGELAGVHKYSAHMLLCLALSRRLRGYYREHGINDDIWKDSMLDMKWKLWQCKLLKGIWGTFVVEWYGGFFNLTRFAFGRLQFDFTKFHYTYKKDGKTLLPGMTVVGVHIPRTLTPFSVENCDASFARAIEFFRDKTGDAPLAFTCHSWILWPEHENILSEKSNVRKFMSRFDIVRSYIDPAQDVTGVFDMEPTGDIEDYPENSFLQKAYKDFLRSGGKVGKGIGVFFAE